MLRKRGIVELCRMNYELKSNVGGGNSTCLRARVCVCVCVCLKQNKKTFIWTYDIHNNITELLEAEMPDIPLIQLHRSIFKIENTPEHRLCMLFKRLDVCMLAYLSMSLYSCVCVRVCARDCTVCGRMCACMRVIERKREREHMLCQFKTYVIIHTHTHTHTYTYLFLKVAILHTHTQGLRTLNSTPYLWFPLTPELLV